MKNVSFFLFGLILSVNLVSSNTTNKSVNIQNQSNTKQKAESHNKKTNTTLDVNIDLLISKATQARENAYCPYSKFKVGAAVLSESGQIYIGCNVENASYGVTNCAERTAIFKMVSEGEKKIKAIAIVLDAEDFGAPCGACRQVIYEFGQKADVIMATTSGKHEIVKIIDLLPYAFCLDDNKE